jgi:hypothetical protein
LIATTYTKSVSPALPLAAAWGEIAIGLVGFVLVRPEVSEDGGAPNLVTAKVSKLDKSQALKNASNFLNNRHIAQASATGLFRAFYKIYPCMFYLGFSLVRLAHPREPLHSLIFQSRPLQPP